jgi:hypothetical protein
MVTTSTGAQSIDQPTRSDGRRRRERRPQMPPQDRMKIVSVFDGLLPISQPTDWRE